MVYDQNKGFTAERTLLEYARSLNLVNGSRLNARYLGDRDDVKFNEKDIINEFKRPEVDAVFKEQVYPHLEKLLSRVGLDEQTAFTENNEGINSDALFKIMTEV